MMVYTVIDFKEGTSRTVTDKRSAAKVFGVSIPTLDKRVPGVGYYMEGQRMLVKAELEKSRRGL